jgi:DNA helicase II / ATP-dependent DNA helicase PcrA
MDTASGLNFKGFIDAIFKNGDEYLIVDWKTDSSDSRAPNHRQQLEAYKRAYSQIHGIPLEKIKVAIGYVGLRARINDGEIGCLLDDKQPAKSAFETFCKKCNRIIAWKENPDSFLNEFFDEGVDDHIWRSIVEQWEREK